MFAVKQKLPQRAAVIFSICAEEEDERSSDDVIKRGEESSPATAEIEVEVENWRTK